MFVLGLISARGGIATTGGPYGTQPRASGCFRVLDMPLKAQMVIKYRG